MSFERWKIAGLVILLSMSATSLAVLAEGEENSPAEEIEIAPEEKDASEEEAITEKTVEAEEFNEEAKTPDASDETEEPEAEEQEEQEEEIDVPGYTGWYEENGNQYWYEDGIRQGTVEDDKCIVVDNTVRGREIYDPGSKKWYWLDAENNGAKARNKEVWIPYIYSDEAMGSTDGKWVRYDNEGHMVTGSYSNAKGYYYYSTQTGAMIKGYDVVIDGKYLGSFDPKTGVALYHLRWVDGRYWYECGIRQGYDISDPSYRGKEIYDPGSNAWYWLDNNAAGKKAVLKDVYQPYTIHGEDNIGKWVRYDAVGHMIKGWDSVGTNDYDRVWYYFDQKTGAMAHDWKNIGGTNVYFNHDSGIMESSNNTRNSIYLYRLEVNKVSNVVTVYMRDDNGRYTIPIRAITISAGEATPVGNFNTYGKARYRSLMGGVWGQYVTYLTGPYYFHSVPSWDDTPNSLYVYEYNALGNYKSHGCIRMAVRDAKWLYDNCPVGTSVTVYNDANFPGPLGKPTTIYVDPADPRSVWDPTDPDPMNPWLN